MIYAIIGGTGSYYLELILFIAVCAIVIFGAVDCYVDDKRVEKMLDEGRK